MENELLSAALLYASIGWRVFPLKPRDKSPATINGFKNATTDEGQIRAWWAENPAYNIGIATGNGLVVIDVDDKPEQHNGLLGSDFLRDWEEEHGRISDTITAISGTGGTHYYFNVGHVHVPSCQSDTIFIDLRADGGYIVAPPSIHPDTGTPYMWDVEPTTDDLPTVANAIDKACIDWVYANRKGVTKDGKTEKPHMETVREGEGRNNYLYRMGCAMRAQGGDDTTIAIYIAQVNAQTCKPPLGNDELSKVIHSVCKLPIGLSDEAKAAKDGKGTKQAAPRFEHNKVGKRLIEEFGAVLIDGETPAVRMTDGRYRMGWEAFDTLIIDLYDDCKESNRRETKAYVKAKAPSAEQASPFLIGFNNGVLDVQTLEFRDYKPTDVIPNIIPHDWNENARSEMLERTLDKMACGDISTLLNLTEFIGMCMMRDVQLLPYFPVLIGEGSNGKSTYINLLENVVGRDNISGMQPKEITAHFMGVHIVGKTANLGDDIAGGYLDTHDCSVIKSIATGDLLFTDVKGTKGYYFHPYCTMVFSCNQFPRLADTTPGFMRRLFPVEFNAVFSADDPDYDPLIGRKLRDEKTLQAACVLGVEGLRRALAQNRPTPNELSTSMKSEIASEANTVLQWVHDDGITAQHLAGMTKQEAYSEYREWCEKNGYERTAVGGGTLVAQIGTIYHLKLCQTAHREYPDGRKTVRVFAPK